MIETRGTLFICDQPAGVIATGRLHAHPHTQRPMLTASGQFLRYWVTLGARQATAQITLQAPARRLLPRRADAQAAPIYDVVGDIQSLTTTRIELTNITMKEHGAP